MRFALPALMVLIAVRCGSDGGGDGGDGPLDPDPAPSTLTVTTGPNAPPRFIPATAELAAGGTVTWTNGSPGDHNLMATTGNWQLNRTLAIGETQQETITNPGTYGYQCTIHPGMTASIVVR